MPQTVELTIHQAPGHENMSIDAYEKRIAEEIVQEESNIADEMTAANRRFLGMNAVLRQSHGSRPASFEIRRGMNPRFASRDKELRISAIKRYEQFVSQYWQALKAWRQGNREVQFPAGTYAMRIRASVNVSPG